jgi:hypothetical protein
LGEVSVLSQILNIKLSSFTMLERKERKKERRYTLCTRVNRDLLTSVLTSTAILSRFISVVDMNYDPFFDFLAPPTIFDERTLRRPHE